MKPPPLQPRNAFDRLVLVEEEKERKRREGLRPVAELIPSTLSTQTSTRPPGSEGSAATPSTLGTAATPSTLSTQTPAPAKRDSREQLNLKLPKDLLEEFRRWCFESKVSQRDAVVAAIEALMGRRATPSTLSTSGSVGRILPTSDDDIEDDDRAVIDLYEHVTGNRWNDADRELLDKTKHLGRQCLLCAVALGRDRTRAKINSFRFFEKIITEVGNWTPDKIDKELAFRLNMLKHRGVLR